MNGRPPGTVHRRVVYVRWGSLVKGGGKVKQPEDVGASAFPAREAGGIRFNLAERLSAPLAVQRGSKSGQSLSFRRMAQGDDLEPLLDLVEVGHKESRFGYIPFSREKARKIGGRALADPARNLLIVAELRDRPVGFLLASVGEFHIGTDVRLATIHAAYTVPECRATLLGGRVALGLIRAVQRWSAGTGAKEIFLHITSGISIKPTTRMIKRIGFATSGGVFAAQLS